MRCSDVVYYKEQCSDVVYYEVEDIDTNREEPSSVPPGNWMGGGSV